MYRRLLSENKIWVKRAAAIALVWFVIGAVTYFIYPDLLPKLTAYLDEVFEEILGGEQVELNFATATRIFLNNLQAGVLSIFFGLALGIVPVLALGINFFVLGFLFAVFALHSPMLEEFSGLSVFIISILPHGVVEIPAFLLATGMGLRMGFFWLEPKVDPEASRAKNLLRALKQSALLLPLIAVLFFIAALIEVFITGNLIDLVR